MIRRYVFKLYPDREQEALLHEQRMMMVDLWNALKQRHEDVYRRTRGQRGVRHAEGKSVLTFFDLTNEITALRHECPEWVRIPAITAHRVAKHLVDSYDAFFRRLAAGESPGYPRWHRRERATTIPLGTMLVTGWRLEQRDDNPLSWRLHYGSVTDVRDRDTWIHARGVMPVGQHSPPRRERRGRSPLVTDWRNADIIWRDGKWWLSVCVEISGRRDKGQFPTKVELNLLDCFARVNGLTEDPPGLAEAEALNERVDAMKSERDRRWPRGERRGDEEQREFLEAQEEIRNLSGLIARQRRDALHVWTARIVSRASDLTVIAPALQAVVKTPRGDKRQWGAHVRPVSDLNRHVVAQAPGMALQMLKYKAEESGIRCDIVTDEAPEIVVGGDLVAAGKEARRARRKLKELAA